MKHTQRNINHKTYKNMHDTISKYVLSLGLFVFLAGDCNPTPDTKSEEAFFKQIAFTAHNVKYDFHLTPAPGTLSINDQSVNLANAQQTASGATLVVDGKTLHLQAVSYSGGTFETDDGKEIPVLGIAIEDDILTGESVLISVSGLQRDAVYQYQIGTEGDKQDIVSSSTGEIEFKKSHLNNGNGISIENNDEIVLYSDSDDRLGIIARYKKYEIHDWKDLQGMRQDLTGDYTLENHIELPEPEKGGLPKEGFDPIGTGLTSFTGSFNGKGLTISKFSIDPQNKNYVGLFGSIQNKSEVTAVKDVKIAILGSVHGRDYVGGVVGYLRSGTITGVEVTGGDVSGTNNIGGVAGTNYGKITNSYALGSVSRKDGSRMNLNWVVDTGKDDGTVENSYYPYRGDKSIGSVNAHDPSANSVKKDVFEKLKRSAITMTRSMIRSGNPFNGWNFATTNGDWEWIQGDQPVKNL